MECILVDGRNAAYKAAWVGRSLKAATGQDTGAMHGILSSLLALKHKHPGAKFVVVWDGMDTIHSWRNKLFPDYKANRRRELPDDVKALRISVGNQISAVKDLFDGIGVSQIEIPRLEADDVVGILSAKCLMRGWEVSAFSSDQDYLQLIPDGVSILTSASGPKVSAQDIQNKWHCAPCDLLKLRALLGDHSDGIPRAVSGVGPVAAARYVAAGVDASVECFGDLPRDARLGSERLEPYWGKIHMNYRLMRMLRACKDSELSSEDSRALIGATRRILKELREPVKRHRAAYEGMIKTFAEMDLSVAMSNRTALWQLQIPA